ncbi:MAG TPA: hypothetical protein ENN67_04455, partial [Firmicutes bacterium]|nr:hypothetical protein [Bacillota bacterium]
MKPLRFHFMLKSIIIILFVIILPFPAYSAVTSLSSVRIFTALGGDIAQCGIFESNRVIDLVFEFDMDSDSAVEARFTWDVYDRLNRNVFSNSENRNVEPGLNVIRFAEAIPTNLATGMHTYRVYASVKAGDIKKDSEFEIRIRGTQPIPGVHIEDVRLVPREHDLVTVELKDAAIPYRLEIDFTLSNVYTRYARIRWIGVTVDGFTLDNGTATTSVHNGLNTYKSDSYLARPSSLATPQASFIVDVAVFDQVDSVSFPLETLPFS